jgi:hypothetical protein|uniref:Uncharacterized protein n=1 Tax=viral metagenome TaxID=1070528 RepID=A0A6C0J1I1_9ZZZZ
MSTSNKKYIIFLEDKLEENYTLVNNYRIKSFKHKTYFQNMWTISLIVLFNYLELSKFIPTLILGMISVSYVNSTYLNIPILKNT